jgi:hypothetical protein
MAALFALPLGFVATVVVAVMKNIKAKERRKGKANGEVDPENRTRL